ncbi:MAG: hypothetical protein ACMUIE_00010 [Thermoplasmatota archaeon]
MRNVGILSPYLLMIILIVPTISVISSGADDHPPARAHPFDGGSGIPEDPYLISLLDQLQQVHNYSSSSFRLTGDINAHITGTWNDGNGFLPICYDTSGAAGHQGYIFTGVFDGAGHSIMGLHINRTEPGSVDGSDWTGLFGRNGGTIRDLKLEDAEIIGKDNIGGIAAENSGLIHDCSFTGTIKGKNVIGGISAFEDYASSGVEIYNCSSSGEISGTTEIGGIVGWAKGKVLGCTSTCNITADGNTVGGIAGRVERCIIRDCSYSGIITAGAEIGGIIGYVYSSNEIILSDCHVTNTTIFAERRVGGVAGTLYSFTRSTISNLSFQGKIEGSHELGGITGNAWTVMDVSGLRVEGSISGTGSGVGGIVGWYYARGSLFSDVKFRGTVQGLDKVGGFSGTNWGGVENVSVEAEVDGNSSVGLICGLNGNGVVKNAEGIGNVTGTSLVGGVVGYNTGNVSFCRFEGNVDGGMYSGSISGSNEEGGMVFSCGGLGDIGGDDNVGGIVGYNGEGSEVELCYFAGSVRGEWYVGGAVGKNDGIVSDTNVFTEFGGAFETGGFVGSNSNRIRRCFSVSDDNMDLLWPFAGTNSGNISMCYYDNRTYPDKGPVKEGYSEGIHGRSWFDMMQRSTFEGWNFRDTWNIGDGYSFPYLRWQEWESRLRIEPDNVTEVDEDQLYEAFYSAEDSLHNDMRMRWEVETNATWLEMNGVLGILSGIPDNNDTGEFFVMVKVYDAKGNRRTHQFNLTVHPVNDRPVIGLSELPLAVEDQYYQVFIPVFDDDHSLAKLDVRVRTNAVWLTFNRNNLTLSGTPLNSHVGNRFVNISAQDPLGDISYANLSLTVNNTNDSPVLNVNFEDRAYEDRTYSAVFTVTDIDPTMDNVLVQMETSALWLRYDPITSTISGMPDHNDRGICWVNLTADDRQGGRSWYNLSFEVIAKYNGAVGPFIFTDGSPIKFRRVTLSYDGLELSTDTNSTGHALFIDIFPGSYSGTIEYDGYFYQYNYTLNRDGSHSQELPDIEKVEESGLGSILLLILAAIVVLVILLVIGALLYVLMKKRKHKYRAPEQQDEERMVSDLEELTKDIDVEVGGMGDLYGRDKAQASSPADTSPFMVPERGSAPPPSVDDLFDDVGLPEEDDFVFE